MKSIKNYLVPSGPYIDSSGSISNADFQDWYSEMLKRIDTAEANGFKIIEPVTQIEVVDVLRKAVLASFENSFKLQLLLEDLANRIEKQSVDL